MLRDVPFLAAIGVDTAEIWPSEIGILRVFSFSLLIAGCGPRGLRLRLRLRAIARAGARPRSAERLQRQSLASFTTSPTSEINAAIQTLKNKNYRTRSSNDLHGRN